MMKKYLKHHDLTLGINKMGGWMGDVSHVFNMIKLERGKHTARITCHVLWSSAQE
jgi:hypothetical protein